MPRPVALTIPQPCAERWAAMPPTATGRHCAACQKTMVDFTQQTDAQILAYLANVVAGRTCGRFTAGQLGRPLQGLASTAPLAARWRTWLAAAVALWGVREAGGVATKAQTPAEWRARYWGAPAPDAPETKEAAATATALEEKLPNANPVPAHLEPLAAPAVVLRGVVTDFSTNEGLPGVTISFKGTSLGVSTTADGTFELAIPMHLWNASEGCLAVCSIGYVSQQLPLTSRVTEGFLQIRLRVQVMGGIGPRPWPWHPRAFYYWSKYWLTRPFRR